MARKKANPPRSPAPVRAVTQDRGARHHLDVAEDCGDGVAAIVHCLIAQTLTQRVIARELQLIRKHLTATPKPTAHIAMTAHAIPKEPKP